MVNNKHVDARFFELAALRPLRLRDFARTDGACQGNAVDRHREWITAQQQDRWKALHGFRKFYSNE